MNALESFGYRCKKLRWLCLAGMLAWASGGLYAQQTLVYDEERGIIFVDKKEYERRKGESAKADAKNEAPATAPAGKGSASSTDLHVGRKKDPPELYFRSGLEYFKSSDYANAEKNFTHAAKRRPKGEYYLWLGKTYRQQDRDAKMLDIMRMILRRYPDGEVADDALFEQAFYYQRTDHYDSAALMYRILAEQYPFGVSYSNGEEFREVSRTQRQIMRAEMISELKILGYKHDTLEKNYRQFQRDNSLAITGRGDRETVKTIKALYEAKLASDAAIVRNKRQTRAGLRWAVGGGGVLIVNIIVALLMRTALIRRQKHLETLKRTLNDLDIQAL